MDATEVIHFSLPAQLALARYAPVAIPPESARLFPHNLRPELNQSFRGLMVASEKVESIPLFSTDLIQQEHHHG
jgi:hypothetical protein